MQRFSNNSYIYQKSENLYLVLLKLYKNSLKYLDIEIKSGIWFILNLIVLFIHIYLKLKIINLLVSTIPFGLRQGNLHLIFEIETADVLA